MRAKDINAAAETECAICQSQRLAISVSNIAWGLRKRGFSPEESEVAAQGALDRLATRIQAKTAAPAPSYKAGRRPSSTCYYCSGPCSDGSGDCGECR